ncbi:LysR family transcriptional regulator [Pseudomonas sp. Xaverov 259]|uniref:LysR family transcriptional regulator n=1 Tax=Pseudomonas sp. Xaverov 259 TaxID=2666086 RepID=UPI001C5BDE08|nr:LysR family transcriptional regulator [Pseudomonas sp. Xaverov 259]
MNLTGHNLALLASLSTLLDERNVTRAAERLSISQPALSAQLARLRDLFGDPLLTPALSGKGMVLTPRGEHLQQPLRQALQVLEDVINHTPLFDPFSAQRVFSLAANDNASAIMAPRLIALTRAMGIQGIRFAFRGIDKNKLPEQMESGDIDLALTGKDAVDKASQLLLLEEEFRLGQRIGHPRGTGPVTLAAYTQLEHVLVSGDGGGFYGFMDEALARKGLARRVGVSVQYYSLVPLILQTTDLVCTLPAQFLERYAGTLQSSALPLEVQRYNLYAAWHSRFDQDPAHAWLRSMLSQCAAA